MYYMISNILVGLANSNKRFFTREFEDVCSYAYQDCYVIDYTDLVLEKVPYEDFMAFALTHSDEIAVRITKQLLNSSKSPTSRQFNYIKPLYEKISGEQYTGTDPESRGLEDLDMTHVLKCADRSEEHTSELQSPS